MQNADNTHVADAACLLPQCVLAKTDYMQPEGPGGRCLVDPMAFLLLWPAPEIMCHVHVAGREPDNRDTPKAWSAPLPPSLVICR